MMSDADNTQKTDQLWHHLSPEEVARRLESDPAAGLSQEEVARRQDKYGLNEFQAKAGKHPVIRFLLEFNQPLIYILLVAGVVTLFLREWVDSGVIFAVTIINAIIGFVQESKAEGAIAALAKTVTTETTVIRGGQKTRIPSQELTLGDVVLLASGDKVPADLRLLELRDLQINEAGLTGESVPVQKSVKPLDEDTDLADRENMAYAGSLVTFGQGKGMVVAIAGETETGRISKMIEHSVNLETPLTRKIEQFSKTLMYIILGLAAFTFLLSVVKGWGWAEGFKGAIALAVAAIPEGLPAVVTVTLAIGVSRMANRNAIIRKLPAVETLGSTTVICSDKTGTLTENQMTVQAIYAGGETYSVSGVGYGAEGEIQQNEKPVEVQKIPPLLECLQSGLLCNDSHLRKQDGRVTVAGDPTEGALIVSARKAGLSVESLEKELPREDTIPFESEFQYMATLHRRKEDSSRKVIYVKGSLEALLERCKQMLDAGGKPVSLDQDAIEQAANNLAKKGLRVLAFAKKEVDSGQKSVDHEDLKGDLILLGLQGMIDPPRPEAVLAVKACRSAGIQVKMITGDHALTAAAIARQMGLQEEDAPVYTGQQLGRMSDSELAEAVEATAVFARVAPEKKLRLVKALQSQGEIVAMTGDGVNDAPALKQADIGVAMGITGTEVAKEAADMVLTDDNFASIEAAVEEGRTVYRNLLKAIGFIIPVNGGETMTILAGMLFSQVIPILPLQVLWVNMVSSVALTSPLAFEPKSKDVMRHPPRDPNEPLLSARLLLRIVIISIFNLIASFGIFEWVLQTTDNLVLARTMAVQTLVAAETFYLISISSLVPSLFGYLKSRSPIAYASMIGVASVLVVQFVFSQWGVMNHLFNTTPLNGMQALTCIMAGIPVMLPALLLKRFAPLG